MAKRKEVIVTEADMMDKSVRENLRNHEIHRARDIIALPNAIALGLMLEEDDLTVEDALIRTHVITHRINRYGHTQQIKPGK